MMRRSRTGASRPRGAHWRRRGQTEHPVIPSPSVLQEIYMHLLQGSTERLKGVKFSPFMQILTTVSTFCWRTVRMNPVPRGCAPQLASSGPLLIQLLRRSDPAPRRASCIGQPEPHLE